MSTTDPATVTPYSTVTPYAAGYPVWIPEEDIERIQAYNSYEWMYWNNEEAFELVRRPEDGPPIYLPTPRTIVNSTSHFLLKGLTLTTEDPEKQADFWANFSAFLAREKFYSNFNIAKKAGVCRGDWVFHITANPDKQAGARISLTTLDPASYFPVYDEDDLDQINEVRIVDQMTHPEDPNRTLVKVLHYGYDETRTRVWREENIWEMEGWNNPEQARRYKQTLSLEWFDPRVTQIPVYHFKNDAWDGLPFGNSELRGFERVFQAINQSASDEDLALALDGLGVYATDAGRPIDDTGRERDWEVYPGVVLEVPGATMFKRVEGISSITPVQDHIKLLREAMYDASGITDVALGDIDTNVAESGIALAIKFLPMAAKIADRDQEGLDVLTQMFYDLKFWFLVYEGWNYLDIEIIPELGEKLPLNKAKVVEELNNMLDRKVISRAHFRREMVKLGYTFPDNIGQEILEEELLLASLAAQQMPGQGQEEDVPGPGGRLRGPGDTLPSSERSDSNNTSRVNESSGTEIDSDN